jgi:hypothetical protein
MTFHAQVVHMPTRIPLGRHQSSRTRLLASSCLLLPGEVTALLSSWRGRGMEENQRRPTRIKVRVPSPRPRRVRSVGRPVSRHVALFRWILRLFGMENTCSSLTREINYLLFPVVQIRGFKLAILRILLFLVARDRRLLLPRISNPNSLNVEEVINRVNNLCCTLTRKIKCRRKRAFYSESHTHTPLPSKRSIN